MRGREENGRGWEGIGKGMGRGERIEWKTEGKGMEVEGKGRRGGGDMVKSNWHSLM